MIADNLRSIRAQLPEHVTLVAVSKTKSVALIHEAYDAGQRDFGENRPQELAEKAKVLPEDIRWHFIGHLQSNKVKYIIDHVHLIHSVDSRKLLSEINSRCSSAERKVSCLLQVHIAQEEHKFGFTPAEVIGFFKAKGQKDFPQVIIKGLMGMATFTDEEVQLHKEFGALKILHDSLLDVNNLNIQKFNTLSMGMSGDYLIAIEEGSTMVRIGSSIFGSR